MAGALCYINPTIRVAFRMNHIRPLRKCRGASMKVAMSHNNQPYWVSINDQIEAHLKKVVTVRDPVPVFEPLYHLVFSAPRDTAPALCVAACELVGGRREQAVAAAAALHVFHAASFTHEHLPLSDRPSLIPRPRPRPMMQRAFGPNMELLIGDAMIPFGLGLVTKSVGPPQTDPDRTLRVIVEITRAMGSQGVVHGQYSELQCSQLDSNGSRKVEVMNNTCEKKEGGLHACGAACGAILGGGSKEEIEKLRNYGLYVGMIQGTLRRWTTSPNERSIRVEELRELALKQLEGFDDEAKVEAISSFVEANLSHV